MNGSEERPCVCHMCASQRQTPLELAQMRKAEVAASRNLSITPATIAVMPSSSTTQTESVMTNSTRTSIKAQKQVSWKVAESTEDNNANPIENHSATIPSIDAKDFSKPAEEESYLKWYHYVVAVLYKLLTNLALRFPFPFAPFLAEQLGVSLTVFFFVTAANDGMGVVSVIVGPFVDRYGTKVVFVWGALAMAIALLLPAIFVNYWIFLASWIIYGLGYNFFVAAWQTLLGALVPSSQLARVTGYMESSWSLASLTGFAFVGVLINHFGWRGPFVFLFCSSTPLAVFLYFIFPTRSDPSDALGTNEDIAAADRNDIPMDTLNAQSHTHEEDRAVNHLSNADAAAAAAIQPRKLRKFQTSRHPTKRLNIISVFSDFRKVLRNRTAFFGMWFICVFGMAYSLFFASYGSWLSDEYDLSAESVGFTAVVIGLGELSGAAVATFGADRLSLSRSVALASSGNVIAYFILYWVCNISLPAALASLFFLLVVSEFCIVTTISYLTVYGSAPELRGTKMALFFGMFALGRSVGSLIADPVYSLSQIKSTLYIGILGHFVALLCFLTANYGIGPSLLCGLCGDNESEAKPLDPDQQPHSNHAAIDTNIPVSHVVSIPQSEARQLGPASPLSFQPNTTYDSPHSSSSSSTTTTTPSATAGDVSSPHRPQLSHRSLPHSPSERTLEAISNAYQSISADPTNKP